MAKFDIKSVALKWYFFTTASVSVYEEFSHVFMKQFGLNSQQIGITNLCGVQHIFIPLLLYVGDRYRVRNLVIWIVSPLLAISSLLLLLPVVVSLPTYFGTNSGSNNSCKTIYQCFHLQGHFLAKGNFGTCREKCKEIKLTRKSSLK
jgi:hypothetical protein